MFERLIAYEAICDVCGHSTETFLPAKYERGRMMRARRSAIAQGWTIYADDSAYCPDHKPPLPACHQSAK